MMRRRKEYRAVVDSLITWCEIIHLQLNISRMKELQVDLRKSGTPTTPLFIQGVDVDIFQVYKNQSVHRTAGFTKQRTPT
jgi:hypothetical protein